MMSDGVLNLDFNLTLTTPFLKMVCEGDLTLQNENLKYVRVVGEASLNVLDAVVFLIKHLNLHLLVPENQFNEYGLFTIDNTVPDCFNFIYSFSNLNLRFFFFREI